MGTDTDTEEFESPILKKSADTICPETNSIGTSLVFILY